LLSFFFLVPCERKKNIYIFTMLRMRVAGAFHAPQYCLATSGATYEHEPEPLVAFGHRENIEIVRHLVVSPDGCRIITAGIGLVVRSWSYSDNRWSLEAMVQFEEDPQSPVCWLSIVGLALADPDDDRSPVVAVRSDGLVEWWDPFGRSVRPTQHRITSVPVTVALWTAPYLCTGHWDGTVCVYLGTADFDRGFVFLARLEAVPTVPLRSCGAAPRLSDAYRCARALVAAPSDDNSTSLFVGGLDNVVRQWSLRGDGCRLLGELPGTPESQGILCLAQRGPYLVAGCTVGVLIWAQDEMDPDRTWQNLKGPSAYPDHISAYRNLVTSVRISDDALHIVTSGPHQHTRTTVWSTATGRPVGHLFDRGMCATALALLPPAITHGEALQAVEDISEATGLLPDVSELVFKFLFRDHASAYLALDYYAQGEPAAEEGGGRV